MSFLVKKRAHINQNFGSFFTLPSICTKLLLLYVRYFTKRLTEAVKRILSCIWLITELHVTLFEREFLKNFELWILKNTKLCFRNRLNSPALYRHHVSLKNFFVFHSNSMKVSEVLVHIDNCNFINFHWIQMKNKTKNLMTHLTDGLSIKDKWIWP